MSVHVAAPAASAPVAGRQEAPGLGTGSLSWVAGVVSCLCGAMILIMPHRFQTPAYAAMQPYLFGWGVAFLLLGLAFTGLVVLQPGRYLQALAHVLVGALWLMLAWGFAGVGALTGVLSWGLFGIGIILAPLLSGLHWRRSGAAPHSLLSLLAGLVAAALGGSIVVLWLTDGLNTPVYAATRQIMPLLGLAFLATGLALLLVNLFFATHPRLSVAANVAVGLAYLAYVILQSIPAGALTGITLFGLMGLSLVARPWPRVRAWRGDLYSLRARLVFVSVAVTTVSLVGMVVLISNVALQDMTVASLHEIERTREHSFVYLLLALAGASMAEIVMAGWLARPLANLSEAIDSLAAGRASVPIIKSSIAEVAHLTQAFEDMRQRLLQRTAEGEELLAAQEELARDAEQRAAALDAIFNSMTEAVIVYDKDRNFTQLNGAAREMLGVAPGATVAEATEYAQRYTWPEHGDGRRLEHQERPVVRALTRGEVVVTERFVLRAGERRTWAAMSAAPIRDRDGIIGAVAVLRDVSDQMRANQELERLLRLEQEARSQTEAALHLRDEFLSIAAHELKTPVTSLRGYAQLLRRRFDKTSELEPHRVLEALAQVDKQTRRLARLAEQLLDVSRLESGRLELQPEEVRLPDMVGEMMDEFRHAYPERSFVLQSEPCPPLMVDMLRIQQVLINLVDNAAKFSAADTPIEICVAPVDATGAALTVRDYGIGVSSDDRPHIFERYYQGRGNGYRGGMGIGLYISREIVQMHGGAIDHQAMEGGGSRFIVNLPCGPQPSAVQPGEGAA